MNDDESLRHKIQILFRSMGKHAFQPIRLSLLNDSTALASRSGLPAPPLLSAI